MRARTRPGRLAAFNRWVALTEPPGAGDTVVDVGFGVSAVTTHELAEAFPSVQVIGLEVDPTRVAEARRDFPSLTLRTGGLEAVHERDVALVRIANVGRGLSKEAAQALVDAAGRTLRAGGGMLEGSTDVVGSVAAFHVHRRGREGLALEALVLFTDFSRGFSPWLFRDVLPRALRRDVRPGTAVHALLADWERAWTEHRVPAPATAFTRSLRALEARRTDVDAAYADEGFAVWRVASRTC